MVWSMLVAAFWWTALVVVFRRDRRRVRNGALLVCAVWSTLYLGLYILEAATPAGGLVVLAGAGLMLLGLAALVVFLIANGLTMMRKEGRSLGNALSLLAGIGLAAAPVAAVGLVSTLHPLGIALATLLTLVCLHLGAASLVIGGAALLYLVFPRRFAPTAIIVHGSGLIRGKVPPLLRSRLDRAVRSREELMGTGGNPVLLTSGGQGSDESRAEGEAMAEYLIQEAHVPAERVLVEAQSRTTEENLVLSHRILEEKGHHEPYLVVTSAYHAFRAALIARSLGFSDEAAGARTASYFVPSASLREFVAIMLYRRWWNLAALVPTIALTVLVVWLGLMP